MCFGGGRKAETPAAAPAPALEPADTPEIGRKRKAQSELDYGQEAPNYRVNRHEKATPSIPDKPITM